MTDNERTRTREREPGEERTYDKMLAYYRERVERNAMGPVVIHKDDRDVELSRQAASATTSITRFTRIRRCSSGSCFPTNCARRPANTNIKAAS